MKDLSTRKSSAPETRGNSVKPAAGSWASCFYRPQQKRKPRGSAACEGWAVPIVPIARGSRFPLETEAWTEPDERCTGRRPARGRGPRQLVQLPASRHTEPETRGAHRDLALPRFLSTDTAGCASPARAFSPCGRGGLLGRRGRCGGSDATGGGRRLSRACRPKGVPVSRP